MSKIDAAGYIALGFIACLALIWVVKIVTDILDDAKAIAITPPTAVDDQDAAKAYQSGNFVSGNFIDLGNSWPLRDTRNDR